MDVSGATSSTIWLQAIRSSPNDDFFDRNTKSRSINRPVGDKTNHRSRAWLPPLKFGRLLLFLVTLIGAADTSIAQEGKQIEFHFGETTLLIDKSLIISAGTQSARSLGAIQRLDIPVGEGVYISLPKTVQESFSPPCDPSPELLLRHLTVPARSSTREFEGLVPQPTEYAGISRLKTSRAAIPLELYQFDAVSLRDHWGDQIAFSKTPPLIRVIAQASQQVRFDLAVKADQCFFQNGATFVEQVTSFIASLITRRPD